MVIFTFNPHSMVDIITNSSSELFVFKGKSKELVEEMIRELYPDYLREYRQLVHIDELDAKWLNQYLDYHCSANHWPCSPDEMPLIGNYTFDELYEPKRDWQTGEIERAWNGHIQYELRDNTRPPRKEKIIVNFDEFKDVDPYGEEDWYDDNWNPNDYWSRSFVTEKNIEEVKDRIDPQRRLYFLYSRGDNPNWEYQKKLSGVGKRYHLG